MVELKMLDYRFQLKGKTALSKDIILITIDEKDTELLGRWPWPRKYHADLIQILKMYGAKVIGYDILFTESDKENPDSDACLVSAAKEAGNVCFPMAFSHDKSKCDLLPMKELSKASSSVGFVNVYPDEDGIVRRTKLRCREKSAMGLTLLCRFLGISDEKIMKTSESSLTILPPNGEKITIPLDPDGLMLINYAATTKDWQWLHFVQIIMAFMEQQKGEKPSFDPNVLRNKIVLIGSTHTGMPDIIETPFGSAYGVELHASLINSILQRNFIRPLHPGHEALIFFAVTLGSALILRYLRPLKGALVSGMIVLGFLSLSYILFSSLGFWIKVVKPVGGVLSIYIIGAIYHFTVIERKEREVRKAFRHYVSPALVSELIKNPEKLRLGGEIKELTVLFSDIRGFTAISEKLNPYTLGQILNEYLSSMTGCIFTYDGTLDKFIGDAIMAIYGAPVDLADHPLHGCLSALSMISSLEKLNGKWASEGKQTIKIGVGLNTGKMKVGNFGSRERFDYTVIGDDVNLASRLEGLTKTYGVDIIISASTYRSVKDKMFCRPLDAVMVKGSKKPLEIFELIGTKEGISAETEDKVQNFGEGLKLYYSRRWEEAQAFFVRFLDRFPNDGPAQIILERVRVYTKEPPPEHWDGVFSHDIK